MAVKMDRGSDSRRKEEFVRIKFCGKIRGKKDASLFEREKQGDKEVGGSWLCLCAVYFCFKSDEIALLTRVINRVTLLRCFRSLQNLDTFDSKSYWYFRLKLLTNIFKNKISFYLL